MTRRSMPRLFYVRSYGNAAGCKRIGDIAAGVQFDGGQVVARDNDFPYAITIYPSLDALLFSYGEGTQILWLDEAKAVLAELHAR